MKCDLFVRRTCPNCRPVWKFCKARFNAGHTINCDTPEGIETARERDVNCCPTAIFYNDDGTEIARCHSIEKIRALHVAGTIRYDRLPDD